MAGGPVHPLSAFPVTADIAYPIVYDGAGTTEDRMHMLGLADATTVTGDVDVWKLVFEMPETLPTGTGKLRIITRANATTGVIGLEISWVSVAVTESPDDATLNTENDAASDITTSATADRYTEAKVNLDADTLVAGEFVHMVIQVDDSAHTIAAETGMLFSIIWE